MDSTFTPSENDVFNAGLPTSAALPKNDAPRAGQAEETLPKILEVVSSPLPFSDMLVTADEDVMIRNANGWLKFDRVPYSEADIEFILWQMDPQWAELLLRGGFSRPYVVGNFRLRVTAYLAFRGAKKMLAIRRTPVDPMPFKDTGLPDSVKLMIENPQGLVLLSGATGAGKTTTMAALVDQLNETRNYHIETIEDPIEFVFKRKKSVFSQREVGHDIPTYNEGVRGAMRQRPDVIIIGEIRDRDTAENAILAGESGHLVIATLHASSVSGAIQKLVSFFPGEESAKYASLASSLVGVIHQCMVPGTTQGEGVVATELLFNHKQSFSEFLNSPIKINAALDERVGGMSQSLAMSLHSLVKEGKIAKADALKTVASQGSAQAKLIKMFDLQGVR